MRFHHLTRPWGALISAAFSLLAALAAPASAQTVSPPLRLDDVVRAAVANHPLVDAARARVEAARGSRLTAGSLPNPLLTAQVENTRFPGQGTPAGLQSEQSLFATMPLEPFYQRGARVQRADEEIRAARADLAAARWNVTLEAARAFYRAAVAQLAANSAADVRKGLDELTVYNESRVKEGVAAEGDLIRVKIERDRASIDEAVARAEWVRALAELRPFLGDAAPPPGSPPRLSVDSATAGAALPAFDAIVTRARAQQPELLAARARAEAARAEVVVQRSLTIRQLGASFGNKRIGNQNSMIAGITVPLPFFDRNRGEIARATAERIAAEREAEWVERTLVARIEGAYESAKVVGEQMRTMGGDLAQRAEESRQIAIAAYREGAGTLLQVLDASRTLAEVRLATARLFFAQRETLLQLDAASGVDPLTSFGLAPEHDTTGGHP